MTLYKRNYMNEINICEALGIDHDYQFVTAAFGQSCFKCGLCGEWEDVVEDSQP